MLAEVPLLGMVRPWMLAVGVAVLAAVYLGRDDLLDRLYEGWEWLAIAAAGGYLGWSYGPWLSGLLPI